jgi:hypothetical protein
MLFWEIENVGAVITTSQTPALPYPPVTDPVWTNTSPHINNAWPVEMVRITSATCSHASWIVNWHYSATPGVNTTQTVYNLYSHGSHGSHGSHCSCSRWG